MKNMMTKTKKSNLDGQIRLYISQAISEILSDPDYGMELSEKTKERLRRISNSTRNTVSFDEVKKKYL